MIEASHLSVYRKCVCDIDNFIYSHSDDFSALKFLSRRDMKNLHRLFRCIEENAYVFHKFADACDLHEFKDGRLELVPYGE